LPPNTLSHRSIFTFGPGIVVSDIETPESVYSDTDRVLDLLTVRDIGLNKNRLAAVRLDRWVLLSSTPSHAATA
jgi:hypothetical protein